MSSCSGRRNISKESRRYRHTPRFHNNKSDLNISKESRRQLNYCANTTQLTVERISLKRVEGDYALYRAKNPVTGEVNISKESRRLIPAIVAGGLTTWVGRISLKRVEGARLDPPGDASPPRPRNISKESRRYLFTNGGDELGEGGTEYL